MKDLLRADATRARSAILIMLCALPLVFPADTVAKNMARPTGAPAVTKVEPPSWWVGLTPGVMLLLTGQNLEGATVASVSAGVRVERTRATTEGKYLFVWLAIPTRARPGIAILNIKTVSGAARVNLPLARREAPNGKFQGLTQDDVLYLIMPDRFANGDASNDEPADAPGSHDRAKPRAYHGGDLRGIRDHLPYLQDLGVTALWLTPIVKNGAAQDYHGYGAVDLYAVDEHLGTIEEYRALVAAAHEKGMKIFFDAVPNHVGPRHPWVANAPLPDWFHGTPEHHTNSSAPPIGTFYGAAPGGPGHDPFEALADPHAPPRLWRHVTEGWFFGLLPDLNTENPLVAQYLLQNSIWWMESSGLDGFRVDTFPYVSRAFWANWHAGLRRLYPRLTTIGEVFHPDPSVTSFFAGGEKRWDGIDSGLSTLFDFPLYFTLRDVLLREAPVGRIADVLRHDSLYPHPDDLVDFFANHDVKRFASEPGSSLAKLKLAFSLVLTLRGIPELYYGDEIGMEGESDPDNRRDFPGGWPGDAQNAFTTAGRTSEQQEIFSHVQTLLRLRRGHSALRRGRHWHLFSDEKSYVFLGETPEERLLVVFSNAEEPRQIPVALDDTPAQGALQFELLFGNAKAEIANGEANIRAAPQSLSIFRLK